MIDGVRGFAQAAVFIYACGRLNEICKTLNDNNLKMKNSLTHHKC